MAIVKAFEKSYEINVNDSDFTGKTKISSIFNFFQESASIHAQNLGAGFYALSDEHDIAWILTKMRVDIYDYPLWRDEVKVKTWPLPPEGIQYIRDFVLSDKDKKILAAATSCWVIADKNTKRLKRPADMPFEFSSPGERAIKEKPKKIRPRGEKKYIRTTQVLPGHIDLNGHMNNSRYADFVTDCFTVETQKKHKFTSLEISYMKEAFPGDEIDLFLYDSVASKENFVEGVNRKTDEVIFTSKIIKCPLNI